MNQYPRGIWWLIIFLAGGEYALVFVLALLAPPQTKAERCWSELRRARTFTGQAPQGYYEGCMQDDPLLMYHPSQWPPVSKMVR